MKKRIAIVGGCGHVGLPLGLALAHRGFQVTLLDRNVDAVESINKKVLPFVERGAQALLDQHGGVNLTATDRPQFLREQEIVVFVTGTPMDEYLNPRWKDAIGVIESYTEFLNPQQLIVLRSTVFPGTTEVVSGLFKAKWGTAKVAFCPERIAQGSGIEEIFDLPQILSATSSEALAEARHLFSQLTSKTVELEPREAELAKLITNSWRYLEFAIANQFYMMVESQGMDFHKIFGALTDEYPRAAHFAKPGLAAGPCLFKDTMQLSAFHKNNFFLGQSAMLVNEGMAEFLVDQLASKLTSLKGKKIAILGMTFKANVDDTRESLSFKIKKILEFNEAIVLPSDPYLPNTVSCETAVVQADGVILGVPHREYLELKIEKPFVDCWNVWARQ